MLSALSLTSMTFLTVPIVIFGVVLAALLILYMSSRLMWKSLKDVS
jgi:hypothetical protein